MIPIDIGKHILARALADRTVRPFTEAGLTAAWLGEDESAAVFEGTTLRAWQFLLAHADRHGRTPPLELFRREFPEAGFRLPSGLMLASELIELAQTETRRVIIQSAQVAIQDVFTRSDFAQGDGKSVDQAASVIAAAAARLKDGIRPHAEVLNLTDPVDRDAYFADTLQRGAPFGIPGVDEDFFGIQPGHLIALIGRQKSTKTFLTLNSAVQAWLEGWDVLFYTFEMGAKEVRDRAYALGAHVNPELIRRRDFDKAKRRKVEDFMDQLENDQGAGQNFRISEGSGSFTIDDLLADIIRYEPHMVYVDGSYFITDRHTRKSSGSDWVAGENVARELKTAARQHEIGLFVTTQAQEKQHNHRAAGIEGRSIMNSTGLLRTPDLVLGADMDRATRILTLNCVMSRYAHVETARYRWDWDSMVLAGARDSELEEDIREMGI